MAEGVSVLSIALRNQSWQFIIEKNTKNGRNFPVAHAGDIAEFIVYCSRKQRRN
jgi:hypothetical protein